MRAEGLSREELEARFAKGRARLALLTAEGKHADARKLRARLHALKERIERLREEQRLRVVQADDVSTGMSKSAARRKRPKKKRMKPARLSSSQKSCKESIRVATRQLAAFTESGDEASAAAAQQRLNHLTEEFLSVPLPKRSALKAVHAAAAEQAVTEGVVASKAPSAVEGANVSGNGGVGDGAIEGAGRPSAAALRTRLQACVLRAEVQRVVATAALAARGSAAAAMVAASGAESCASTGMLSAQADHLRAAALTAAAATAAAAERHAVELAAVEARLASAEAAASAPPLEATTPAALSPPPSTTPLPSPAWSATPAAQATVPSTSVTAAPVQASTTARAVEGGVSPAAAQCPASLDSDGLAAVGGRVRAVSANTHALLESTKLDSSTSEEAARHKLNEERERQSRAFRARRMTLLSVRRQETAATQANSYIHAHAEELVTATKQAREREAALEAQLASTHAAEHAAAKEVALRFAAELNAQRTVACSKLDATRAAAAEHQAALEARLAAAACGAAALERRVACAGEQQAALAEALAAARASYADERCAAEARVEERGASHAKALAAHAAEETRLRSGAAAMAVRAAADAAGPSFIPFVCFPFILRLFFISSRSRRSAGRRRA